MRERTGRGVAALGLVAIGVIGACGAGEEAGPPDVEIAAADVAGAAAMSTTLPYRFTGTMSFGRAEDVPILSGMWDGERAYHRVDLEAMADEMGINRPLDLDALDLSLEMVNDAGTTYLHGPDLGAFVQSSDSGSTPPPLFAVLADLGASWGRIDVAALGPDAPAGVLQQLGAGQGTDPRIFLDMLSRTEDVEPLGPEEMGGVPTTGAAADVSFVDMVEAQGFDADEITAGMIDRTGVPADEARRIIDVFTIPIEVWIDADDHVRRITVDLAKSMRAVAEEFDEDVPDLGTFSITVDFTDYDDASIHVDIPDPAATVDITENLRTILDA